MTKKSRKEASKPSRKKSSQVAGGVQETKRKATSQPVGGGGESAGGGQPAAVRTFTTLLDAARWTRERRAAGEVWSVRARKLAGGGHEYVATLVERRRKGA